jgi:membrane protein DedA with SNARE-associated domain/rhodanese-related sulfurtransferase
MDTLLSLLAQHGLLLVFLAVLAEQLGAPLPSLPLLMLVGGRAAHEPLFGLQALLLAALAATLANSLWFWAGRRWGRRVLSTLCRISLSPDLCVRRNEASFARRGGLTLVLARFLPGLSILAAPLAGAMGMPAARFMRLNGAGTLVWGATGLGLGALFHRQIEQLLAGLAQLGQQALVMLAGLVLVYLLWRLLRRLHEQFALRGTQGIAPAELAALQQQYQAAPVLLDVRAPLPGQARIPGAQGLDLGALDPALLQRWPHDAEFVTYCACPHDVSAAKAARWLQQQGRRARVLRGGIEGWQRAGLALDDAA